MVPTVSKATLMCSGCTPPSLPPKSESEGMASTWGLRGQRKVEFWALVSAGSPGVLFKDHPVGGGEQHRCCGILPSRNRSEHSCLRETSPGPLGISLVEDTLVVCLPLPPNPIDLSLPPSSLPFSALLPGAEDEVAMGT